MCMHTCARVRVQNTKIKAAFNNADAALFKPHCSCPPLTSYPYARTHARTHARVPCQTRLESSGDIYKGSYDGWYSISDEAFLTDSQVVDLEGPTAGKVCAETGNAVIWMSEENYMFRLSDYEKPLLQWLDENPEGLFPTVTFVIRDRLCHRVFPIYFVLSRCSARCSFARC